MINKLLVLDIETSALSPLDGCIVEIGVVELDLETHECCRVFHTLVNEGHPIDRDAWVFKHSDLKYEDVIAKGKPIDAFRAELQALFDEYYVVAYNQNFDFRWMNYRGFKFPHVGDDPMFIYQKIMKLKGRTGQYKRPSVCECVKYCKLTDVEPHRAADDALIEAKLVDWLYCNKHFCIKEEEMI